MVVYVIKYGNPYGNQYGNPYNKYMWITKKKIIWINHVDLQYLCGLPYGFCAADGFPCGLPQYTLHCSKIKKYGLPYELVVNPYGESIQFLP